MYRKVGKRMLDLVFSILLLFLSAPVLLLACLLVYLVDGRPLFYCQNRVGQFGNEFSLLKIRTMRQGANKLGSTTFEKDIRVIAGGDLIRSLKIDEIPQLLNIFKGEMSLVGPRPTVYEDFEKMNEGQRGRVNVRPGLTGLAQISGNTSLTWPQRIELDLMYIKKITFIQDVKILLITAIKLLFNRISSHPPTGGEWS